MTSAAAAMLTPTDRRLPLVLLCFFLSGFAALLYETAWTREFAFVFGTSELAVVAVLAAYMGGLAAGAALGGRLVHLVRRPVLVYGVLELSIALFALAVPYGIRAATSVYVWRFGGLEATPGESGLAGAIFYLVAAFVILLPCTALMGATLPLLVRHAVRREEDIGGRVGLLYASNTAGAIAGTLVAAFALLPALGLRQTVYCGVAVNALVFAAAALLARGTPLLETRAAPALAAAEADPVDRRAPWILPLIALSGVTSFTYEVLWTRLLGQILGGSVYAFATMLASFLAGIALGSAVASRIASTRRRAGWGFAAAQIGIGALSLAAFAAVDAVPALAARLGAGVRGGLGANALLSAAVLMPAALCIGATFPFAARLLARDEADAAPATARVYAWNTVGAIIGATCAGFVALPLLGFAGTMQAAAALNAALALGGAAVAGLGVAPLAGFAAAGIASLVLLPPQEPWALLRVSPFEAPDGAADRGREGIIYSGVGRSATVLLVEAHGEWELRSNGLVEAYIQRRGAREGKYLAERWLGALAVLARPETRSVLVVGLGGGAAVESVPGVVESISVVELEEEIVEAARSVGDRRRRDPLADPRVRVHVNDARGALLLTEARFDAIVSQPSHPWTAGASHLYTREFFQLVRDHLTPSGVFVQWMGLSFVDEPLVRTLVATLLDVFPHVEVMLKRGELLFLASGEPFDLARTALRAIETDPAHFARLGVLGAEDVLVERVLDVEGARRFSEGAPRNTDDHNRVASRSPQILGAPLGISGGEKLFAEWLPLLADPAGIDVYQVRRLLGTQGRARPLALARAIDDPLDRDAALANVALYAGQVQQGVALLGTVLERDPAHHEARAALLRVFGDRIRRGGPLPRALGSAAGSPLEQAVVAGWRAGRTASWEALRRLEGALAAADPRDPLYASAVRLRVDWRLESGDPERALEGLALLEPVQAGQAFIVDFLLRARAASAAGEPDLALASLAELAEFLTPQQQAYAVAAREVLAQLPPDPERAGWRAEIDERLAALVGAG